ncbi:MAG TPA: hypothetical protein VGO09_11920 [Flavisolibacter sp.]|jgi:hypothetical protein|nr:hypothetical protein [Flavisolibacter sp.]
MNNKIKVGIIGGDQCITVFNNRSSFNKEELDLKKIHICDEPEFSLLKKDGQSQFVSNIESIANDPEISLVFVSSKYVNLAPGLIGAGKSVRVY